MSIQVPALIDRAKRTLGGGGPSFEVMVLDSINSVITDYNRQCDRTIDYLEQVDGEIDVSQKHWSTFFLGTIFYMQLSGEWAREADAQAGAKYQRALAMSQFEEQTDDDLEAGIPEGTWGDGSTYSDVDSETGNVSGG